MRLVTKGLNRNERLIIILYYYEELTMKEIGATLDLSESRVSQMHSSIVQRLQTHHDLSEVARPRAPGGNLGQNRREFWQCGELGHVGFAAVRMFVILKAVLRWDASMVERTEFIPIECAQTQGDSPQ
jgi:hypothetical protein